MAKPIKDTPVLKGEDAIRFAQAEFEIVPASDEEKDAAHDSAIYFASISNFDFGL